MAASGAQDQLERNPGYYQSLLAGEHQARLRDTIQAGQTAAEPRTSATLEFNKDKVEE